MRPVQLLGKDSDFKDNDAKILSQCMLEKRRNETFFQRVIIDV